MHLRRDLKPKGPDRRVKIKGFVDLLTDLKKKILVKSKVKVVSGTPINTDLDREKGVKRKGPPKRYQD